MPVEKLQKNKNKAGRKNRQQAAIDSIEPIIIPFQLFLQRGVISEELVEQMRTWPHSGFNSVLKRPPEKHESGGGGFM